MESLTLSQDGNFLICIAKTSEQPFQFANFHLVIFELNTFGTCGHYIIPGIHQNWNHPSPNKLGDAIKVVEYPSEEGQITRIYTFLNSNQLQEHDPAGGGFSLILWEFNTLNYDLRIFDQRILDNGRGARCDKVEVMPSVQAAANSSNMSQFMSQPGKFRFVTEHSQPIQSQTRKTFLSFWTYDFRDHDLFLDSQTQFDCPLSIVSSCISVTNFLYVQRSLVRTELLIYNN